MRTDEELARGIQRGWRGQKHQQADLAELVERHHSALIGFLYRMTGGDRRLAEDLAQESFIRVMRSIQTYQYPRPFKPWLYAIASNLARDHFKSAEIRHTQPMYEDTEPPSYPEDEMLDMDDAQRVIIALRALPEHQREAVVLRYYNDLSLAEIAETLRIPVGTVKSRLSLGLGRLRALLEEGTKA